MEVGSPKTGIFERQLAREEAITGSPLTTGKQVLPFQDGAATYQAMLAAMLAAHDHATLLSASASVETSVHLTNARFAPDPQLLAALRAAAARGRQDPRAARRGPEPEAAAQACRHRCRRLGRGLMLDGTLRQTDG